jgi:hypothetical protein
MPLMQGLPPAEWVVIPMALGPAVPHHSPG